MRILRIAILSLVFLSLLTLFSIYACENPVTGNGDDEEINPQKPRDLTVTFHGTYVKLEWKASEDAEETGYEILRSGHLLGTVTNDVFTYVDDTFEKGNYYDYSVRTVYGDQLGVSADPVEIFTGYLWYVKYESGIRKLDINSGEEVHRISGVEDSSGLTWDGNYLWVSRTDPGVIYKVDPENGDIIFSFPSAYDYPGGLAFDGEYLWATDGYVYYDDHGYPWYIDYYIRFNAHTGDYVKYCVHGVLSPLASYYGMLCGVEADYNYEKVYIVVRNLDTMDEIRKIFQRDAWYYADFAHDGRYLWISFEGNIYKASENGFILDSIPVNEGYIPGITIER
jgi:hypothetical protein